MSHIEDFLILETDGRCENSKMRFLNQVAIMLLQKGQILKSTFTLLETGYTSKKENICLSGKKGPLG